MADAARCVFCGRPGTSEEHVFATWIADVLKGEGTFTLGRQHGRSKTNLKHLGVTSRAACATCNTTWMSQSEQAVRPLLTPAIQDRAATWSTEAEQTTVAAWAMKTALMLDRSVIPSRRTVPDKDFSYLFEHRKPPPTLFVQLGRYLPSEGETSFAVWTNTAWSTAQRASGETFEGYSISFTVGHVLFIIGAYDIEDHFHFERTVTVAGKRIDALRQLWPLTPGPYTWPPRDAHFNTSGLDVLRRE
jgi:hypothetical protein